MQKRGPSSSRAYCILAELTNSNVLGKLAIRDLNNWVIQKLLLAGLANIDNELYCNSNEFPNLLFY